MRNGPEQVRTCLRRRQGGGRGPGERRLLSGSAAVEGHYRSGLLGVFQPGGGGDGESARRGKRRGLGAGRGTAAPLSHPGPPP